MNTIAHRYLKIISILLLVILIKYDSIGWGFYPHRMINHYAIFTLSPKLFLFYKKNISYIRENATKPDKRRYIIKEESARHYIDLDKYLEGKGTTTNTKDLPRNLYKANDEFSKEFLQAHGSLPWIIIDLKNKLTRAFRERDTKKILRLSADIGHYIADANVPLHTHSNYNGQQTNQEGIHALWETSIPKQFFSSYNLFVGKAEYIKRPFEIIMGAIIYAHSLVDDVLTKEKILSKKYKLTKYRFMKKGKMLSKEISPEYVAAYSKALGDQVESQFRKSIKMVGDFIYTAWCDAGKPDLDNTTPVESDEEDIDIENCDKTKIPNLRVCD